jgi:hypothetical protein
MAVVVSASLFGTLFVIVCGVVVLGTWVALAQKGIRLAPPEIGA